MINFNLDDNGTMSQEQMKAGLMNAVASLDNSFRNANTSKFVTNAKLEETRIKSINELFDILEQNGINPGNQLEIKEFMDKLKTSDPQLYSLLEENIDGILEDKSLPVSDSFAPNANTVEPEMLG